MSELGTYELTHPELLSEHQLREILKNSCIEILDLQKLCKNELLEMYKRVSMPLPQRQRGKAKSLSTEVNIISEKSISSVSNNDTHSLTADLDKGNKRMFHSLTDRLKSSDNIQKSMHKKIRSCSTPKVETACNGISKRRCDEQNEELTKKRQKITWP